jgi:hypothetical protein
LHFFREKERHEAKKSRFGLITFLKKVETADVTVSEVSHLMTLH